MNSTAVRRISIFSQWTGLADPCCRTSRLHLIYRNGKFHRVDRRGNQPQIVETALIDKLLSALSAPPVTAPDLVNLELDTSWLQEHATELAKAWSQAPANEQSALSLGERFQAMVEGHFGSMWTDDYPTFRIKIVNDDGSCLVADSEAQHAFMIPWTLHGTTAPSKTATFNAQISCAVAGLLPADFLNRERLLGSTLAFSALIHMVSIADEKNACDPKNVGASAVGLTETDRALLAAANAGDVENLRLSLAAGANVAARDENGRTPLILAVVNGNREAVRLLVANGSPLDARDTKGATALSLSLRESSLIGLFAELDGEKAPEDKRDHESLLELLFAAGADPNVPGAYDEPPLVRAVEGKNAQAVAIVRRLLRAGANPSAAEPSTGQTALMFAAFPPFHEELFRLLVEAGADVDARRNDGYSGLHLAACGGESKAARAWIEAGADVNLHAADENRHTPLMLAAEGWIEIAQGLLAHGADVNAAETDGWTPLIHAVHGRQWSTEVEKLPMVKLLLAHGADVAARDQAGRSALSHLLEIEDSQRVQEEVRRELRAAPEECEPDVAREGPAPSDLHQLLLAAGCRL